MPPFPFFLSPPFLPTPTPFCASHWQKHVCPAYACIAPAFHTRTIVTLLNVYPYLHAQQSHSRRLVSIASLETPVLCNLNALCVFLLDEG